MSLLIHEFSSYHTSITYPFLQQHLVSWRHYFGTFCLPNLLHRWLSWSCWWRFLPIVTVLPPLSTSFRNLICHLHAITGVPICSSLEFLSFWHRSKYTIDKKLLEVFVWSRRQFTFMGKKSVFASSFIHQSTSWKLWIKLTHAHGLPSRNCPFVVPKSKNCHINQYNV